MPITLDAVEAHILSCLRSAGPQGIEAPFGLRRREQKALIEAALRGLRQSHGISTIWRGQHAFWLLPEHVPDLEQVCQQLSAFIHEQGPEQIFTSEDLGRALDLNAATFANEAIYWLEADGLLRRVHHEPSQQTFFMLAASTHEPAQASPAASDVERLMAAYFELRRRRGLDFVEISELESLTGISHSTLEAILLEALSEGWAQVTGTNLAILPQEAADAAITWQGHRCALVKLQSEV